MFYMAAGVDGVCGGNPVVRHHHTHSLVVYHDPRSNSEMGVWALNPAENDQLNPWIHTGPTDEPGRLLRCHQPSADRYRQVRGGMSVARAWLLDARLDRTASPGQMQAGHGQWVGSDFVGRPVLLVGDHIKTIRWQTPSMNVRDRSRRS